MVPILEAAAAAEVETLVVEEVEAVAETVEDPCVVVVHKCHVIKIAAATVITAMAAVVIHHQIGVIMIQIIDQTRK
jgi:hypothetical protein